MTDDKVIAFPPRDRPGEIGVWVCNCDTSTHYHRENGEVVCANCGNIASRLTGNWRERLPPAPEVLIKVTPDSLHITDLGSPEIAIQRALRNIEPNLMVALVSVRDDGALSVWSQKLTPKSRKWLRARLLVALERMS